jgi:hypothetical protein
MTVEEHAKVIAEARDKFNATVMAAKNSGLGVNTKLSGDNMSIYSVSVTLVTTAEKPARKG